MSSRRDSRRDGKNGSKYNPERVNRWRRQAEKRAKEVETLPAYAPARLVAAEEGKPLSELIVDILCRERLRGKVVRRFRTAKAGLSAQRLYNAHMDTFVERQESIKCRDNYERDLVRETLSHVAANWVLDNLNLREIAVLLRRFYVKGDLTAHKAILRAMRFSLNSYKGDAR